MRLSVERELIVHPSSTFNAEPPLAMLAESFLTPVPAFYVRTHGSIPRLDAVTYRLTVRDATRERTWSLEDVRAQFEHVTLTAVLQCAGNRRTEFNAIRAVEGQPWDAGAIGNATWTGVRLRDVLDACGPLASGARHVAFTAWDDVEVEGRRFPYAVSIPLAAARSPHVLLAWAMNGTPLTPEHGAPLRVLVPGFAGVRSPKWLRTIEIREHPSDGYFQAEDYRLFAGTAADDGGVARDSPDGAGATGGPLTINAMPLTSAICVPAADALVAPGPLTVAGYAVAAAGARVARVEVSGDGGTTWCNARLDMRAADPYAWTPWRVTLDVGPGDRQLVARAWDDAGQLQSPSVTDLWNPKGYLNAAWHRVRIHVTERPPDVASTGDRS